MSSSEPRRKRPRRTARVFTLVAIGSALAATVGCSPGPTRCLRYSDCDPGLTCAYGLFVFPPVSVGDGSLVSSTDAGADASTSDALVATSDDAGDEATDEASADDAPTE